MRKLQAGKELNLYECCSIYSMHTAVWMFGWVISPEAAYMALCKQLHIKGPIDLDGFPNCWYYNETVSSAVNEVMNSAPGTKKYLIWDDYSKDTRVALALNGAYVEHDRGYVYGEPEDVPGIVAPSDYKPGCINVMGIKIYESLFDYLENKGVLTSPIFRT